MELRHLRYFLAVAETRSFTRAAERLHVTQPTLSHQIKQLESIVGTVLFERSTRDVELTAAGRLFKPYCERILKEIESSALAISELEGLMRGMLRMAVFHSFSHSMLPAIMSEFTLRCPQFVHRIQRSSGLCGLSVSRIGDEKKSYANLEHSRIDLRQEHGAHRNADKSGTTNGNTRCHLIACQIIGSV